MDGKRPTLEGQRAIGYFLSLYKEARVIVARQLEQVEIRGFYRDQTTYQKDCVIWGEARLKERTIANLAYLVVFIGVKSAGVELLKSKYLLKYDEGQANALLRQFQLKLAGERQQEGNMHRMQEAEAIANDEKRYEGFQQEFGNYFRQLYQIVKHVNMQEWLKYGDKYGYVKMLRSQLSNQEEDLLFYNSLSDIGMAWEYSDKGKEKSDVNNQLLTKYNLLKNIPRNTTTPKVEDYYPMVAFEDNATALAGREELEKKYR